MKKVFLVALFLSVSVYAFAQGEQSFKSKNGHEVLPQAGDWGFGISANPFLNYFGNFINGTNGNAAPTFNNAGASTILNNNLNTGSFALLGKKIISPNTAYRARFAMNLYNEKRAGMVQKNQLILNNLLPEFVQDNFTNRLSTVFLGAGIEKRKGSTRLQGVYGAEAFLGYFGQKQSYQYGNAIDVDFTAPNSTNFGTGNITTLGGQFARTTESNLGSAFFIGARGYVGVEYFIAPKISLGGELGYSLAFMRNSSTYVTNETFDFDNLKAEKVTFKSVRNAGLTSTGMGLDNTNAAINLYFYF
ncbi:MAG: hypothetical protein KF882_00700 [Bacteroidia bacterium]|nr:hypothetical protein [Bacteroidia bacterium]MCO5252912.1 hypothetical protein [Bacteroidota bacterium]